MDHTGNKKSIPDYSHMKRGKVPEESTWNAADLYANIEAWQEDRGNLEEMIGRIEELSKNWTDSAASMLKLLTHLDEVDKKISRLYVYTSLFADTDMGQPGYQSMRGELQVTSVNLQSRLSFMNPDILTLGEKRIKEYLKTEPGLQVYNMFFDKILRMKDHILSKEKEEITSLTGLFSGAAEKAAEILNNVEMPAPGITLSDGEKITLNQANYHLHREAKNREDRKKVMRTFWKGHSQFKNTLAVLLDAEVKRHHFQARVHNYGSCLEAALYPKNIDVKVYHTLVETVKNNLAPLHRYLELKARLLKLDKMSYDDIYASAIPTVDKTYSLEEAETLVIESLGPLGDQYIEILRQGFANRWMDVYPNKDKRSGAYSNGSVYDAHPYVLMNYNGTFNTVSTLTHEFGHALHSYLSNKSQPYPTSQYPIFLAEIASTFNESLLIHHLVKTEKDDMFKLFILDKYIEDLRGTLYRQVLFADFELAMHEEVEKGKTLTHEWLDEKYLSLTRHFYGHPGVMEVDRYIENEWSLVPHFYYNFYVYQYSTGITAASALADMVLKGGKKERERYLDFLKAGDSDYPLNILKKAGVDMTGPEPILATIRKIDGLVDSMEELAGIIFPA